MNCTTRHWSIIFSILLIVAFSRFIFGEQLRKTGTVGYTFLELPVTARQMGMGEAVGSLDVFPGIMPLFINPGVMGFQRGSVLGVSSSRWLADINHYCAGIIIPTQTIGNFGISINYVDYGDFQLVEENAVSATGTYTAQSLSTGITYARQLTDKFAWGLRLNWIHETIYNYSSQNLLMDVGVLYYTGFRSLRLGGYINNFGVDSRYIADAFKMPTELRLGMAYDLINGSTHAVTLCTEMSHPSDNPERLHLGLEYRYEHFLYLRMGYKYKFDEDPLSFGAGLSWLDYRLDLGVSPFGCFPTVYLITFQREFN